MQLLKSLVLATVIIAILWALQYVFIVVFVSTILFFVVQIDNLKKRLRKWRKR